MAEGCGKPLSCQSNLLVYIISRHHLGGSVKYSVITAVIGVAEFGC